MNHIVFIGGGNMGEALVAGLLASKQWKPAEITVTDKRPDALAQLKKKYKIQISDDNKKAVAKATVILLAVKPQQIRPVLEEIGPLLRTRQLVLSIAAGIPCALIEQFLSPNVPVIRVMPNTPALVRAGAAGIAPGKWAKPAQLKIAEQILSTVGKVVRVSEKDMDAVTAVSGSGPAYVFYIAEAMKDAALALGLTAETADVLVRQTILGAGQLLASSAEEPQELRRRVTSPGGTTEAALQVLEEGQLKSLFVKALRRAAERSQELSSGGLKG
jgi:pyrroline-5-carboxylate reductase